MSCSMRFFWTLRKYNLQSAPNVCNKICTQQNGHSPAPPSFRTNAAMLYSSSYWPSSQASSMRANIAFKPDVCLRFAPSEPCGSSNSSRRWLVPMEARLLFSADTTVLATDSLNFWRLEKMTFQGFSGLKNTISPGTWNFWKTQERGISFSLHDSSCHGSWWQLTNVLQ